MQKISNAALISAAMVAVLASGSASAWTTISPTALTNNTPASLSVKRLSFSDPNIGYQAWAHTGKWATFTAVKHQPVTITVDGSANADFHPAIAVWKRPIGTVEQPYVYREGKVKKYVTNLTPAQYVPDHLFTPTQNYINSASTQQHVLESSGGGCTTTAEFTCATETKTITDINGTPVTIQANRTAFWTAAKRGGTVNGSTGVLLDDGTTDIGLPRMLLVGASADADNAPAIYNPLDSAPNLKLVTDGVAGKLVYTFVPKESVQYEVFLGGWNAGVGAVVDNPITVTVNGAAN